MSQTPSSSDPNSPSHPCALWRRLMAVLYDGFLLVGIWMIAAVAVVVPTNAGVDPQTHWFQLYLLTIAWLYFAVSWRKGCTLGMKAWHVRIQSAQGTVGAISWPNTLIRFIVAWASFGSFGLGFLWSLFHPKKATWHDLATNTYLVVIPKSSARQKQKRHKGNDQRGEQ